MSSFFKILILFLFCWCPGTNGAPTALGNVCPSVADARFGITQQITAYEHSEFDHPCSSEIVNDEAVRLRRSEQVVLAAINDSQSVIDLIVKIFPVPLTRSYLIQATPLQEPNYGLSFRFYLF